MSRPLNPIGRYSNRPLRCHACGCYRHLIDQCPYSWENLAKVVKVKKIRCEEMNTNDEPMRKSAFTSSEFNDTVGPNVDTDQNSDSIESSRYSEKISEKISDHKPIVNSELMFDHKNDVIVGGACDADDEVHELDCSDKFDRPEISHLSRRTNADNSTNLENVADIGLINSAVSTSALIFNEDIKKEEHDDINACSRFSSSNSLDSINSDQDVENIKSVNDDNLEMEIGGNLVVLEISEHEHQSRTLHEENFKQNVENDNNGCESNVEITSVTSVDEINSTTEEHNSILMEIDDIEKYKEKWDFEYKKVDLELCLVNNENELRTLRRRLCEIAVKQAQASLQLKHAQRRLEKSEINLEKDESNIGDSENSYFDEE